MICIDHITFADYRREGKPQKVFISGAATKRGGGKTFFAASLMYTGFGGDAGCSAFHLFCLKQE